MRALIAEASRSKMLTWHQGRISDERIGHHQAMTQDWWLSTQAASGMLSTGAMAYIYGSACVNLALLSSTAELKHMARRP